jgi:hypothetical protein
LRASFDRIREFVLSHALLFRNNGGVVDGGGATQDAVIPVLPAHPNLNPMGASRRRRRGRGGGGRRQRSQRRRLDAGVHRGGDQTPESLYPREGNCHAFFTRPKRGGRAGRVVCPIQLGRWQGVHLLREECDRRGGRRGRRRMTTAPHHACARRSAG